MLLLSRMPGQTIVIDGDMFLTVVDVAKAEGRPALIRVVWGQVDESFTLAFDESREIIPGVTVKNLPLWRNKGRVTTLGFKAPRSIPIVRQELSARGFYLNRPA
jgi:sRNA-binding carbon storage regulator CsrA